MRGFCVISSRNLDSHDRLVVRLRVSVSKRPHGLEYAFAQGDGASSRAGLNELQEPGIAKLLPGRIGRFRKAVADHDEAIARAERNHPLSNRYGRHDRHRRRQRVEPRA